jgi:HK97 family phage major capsid protein
MSRTVLDKTDDATDIVIPETPAQLEEFLHDPKNVVRALQAGKLDDVLRAYASNFMAKELDVSKQVEDQVQTTLRAWLKENREEGHLPVNLGPASGIADKLLTGPDARYNAKNGLFNPRAMGAQLDKEFQGSAGAAEFFNTVWRERTRTLDTVGQGRVKRLRDAFSSDVPSEGGFLIPENLRSEMLSIGLETAVVRPRARVIPMDSLRVGFPMIDSTSNSSSIYGGIVAYWTEEGGTMTDTSPSFGRVMLEAKKLTVYTQVPQELVSDSIISFQPFISQIFPEGLSWYEDLAYLKGNGVGQPLGALSTGNPSIITVTAESGQGANTIVWENIISMYSRMLPSSLNRAVWVVAPNVLPELSTMALSVGTGGAPVWLVNGQGSQPTTLLGRPVIVTEKAPAALGTAGDISLVDFGFYLIGDRQAMSASVSEHYRFPQDEMAFKVTMRVDGRPWLQSAITPQYGGPTMSPFVQLSSTRT